MLLHPHYGFVSVCVCSKSVSVDELADWLVLVKWVLVLPGGRSNKWTSWGSELVQLAFFACWQTWERHRWIVLEVTALCGFSAFIGPAWGLFVPAVIWVREPVKLRLRHAQKRNGTEENGFRRRSLINRQFWRWCLNGWSCCQNRKKRQVLGRSVTLYALGIWGKKQLNKHVQTYIQSFGK